MRRQHPFLTVHFLPPSFFPTSTVTKEEAGLIFDNFKFMKTTKAWKAFEADGNTDDHEAVRTVHPSLPPCLSPFPVLVSLAGVKDACTAFH